MGGHLFIVQGDLRALACDAWILPTSRTFEIVPTWMLFVGFSLNDDNFHKVADAVRRARDPEQKHSTKFGTVLKLAAEPFVEELWKQELDFLSVGDDPRKLEIFLDCALAYAPFDPRHFLHERFSSALSPGELAFRAALVQLLERLPDDARRGPAWERLGELVAQLGGENA